LQTFFITEATSNDETSSKAARACDACYVTVFPLVDSGDNAGHDSLATSTNEHQRHNSDTISSLSNLPSWLSMPALSAQHQPQALMAISLQSSQDLSFSNGVNRVEGDEKDRRARMRVKSHQRLRSYQQIMMDFQEQARAANHQMGQEGSEKNDYVVDEEDDEDAGISDVFSSPLRSYPSSPMRKENTARRSKRFSTAAVALHTTSVTARTTEIGADTNATLGDGTGATPTGDAPPYRRFSLVLAGRNSRYLEADDISSGAVVSKNESGDGGIVGLSKGVAAAKLAALLKKAKGPDV
jgi:FYVE/RhoGEF/PH domain-containing protein 5/6